MSCADKPPTRDSQPQTSGCAEEMVTFNEAFPEEDFEPISICSDCVPEDTCIYEPVHWKDVSELMRKVQEEDKNKLKVRAQSCPSSCAGACACRSPSEV